MAITIRDRDPSSTRCFVVSLRANEIHLGSTAYYYYCETPHKVQS